MKIKQIIWDGSIWDGIMDDTVQFFGGKNIIIKKIGVQALPGTKLIFNGQVGDMPVRVGNTGIFEFSFEDTVPATSIGVLSESLQAIKNSRTQLIIDIFYKEGDEQ